MRFCVTQQNRLIFEQLFFREYFRLYLDAKKNDAVLFAHHITTRKVDAKMRAKIAFEHESQRLSASIHSKEREEKPEYLGFIEKNISKGKRVPTVFPNIPHLCISHNTQDKRFFLRAQRRNAKKNNALRVREKRHFCCPRCCCFFVAVFVVFIVVFFCEID